jgi:hypothetical protein
MCTDCVARQRAEGKGATNCTFSPAGQNQDTVGNTTYTLCAAGMFQVTAGQTECKVCNVVNVSYLYEYLAVTENHVTDDFALAGAAACCVCRTGPYDSDASSPTVCADHRTYGAGNYTSVPGTNSLNPKCNQCEASKFKEAKTPTPPFWKVARTVWRGSVRRAREQPTARSARQGCTRTPLEAPTARSVRQGCTRTLLDKPSARCAML